MPSISGKTGKQYWRSLNELADSPELREVVEREFPARASEWLSELGSASRRSFLKIMGASMALAGLASCRRWPVEELAPYAHRPANRMDGVPVHYATAYELGGVGVGVLATSFDGRPIKTDGNPSHPLSRGGSDLFLQAAVLNVYDPDRSRYPTKMDAGGAGKTRVRQTWDDVAALAKTLRPNGAGLVILTEASRSPSVAAMRRRFGEAKWFEYEAVSNDNQRAGAKIALGRPLRAVPRFAEAAVVVSIDAELFHGDPLSIKYNRDFAEGRRLRDSDKAAEAKMNRLYVIESRFSLTGSMADHRRGIKPSDIAGAVNYLANALTGGGETPLEKGLASFIQFIVRDIHANAGKAVVVAGERQPAEVHAAVAAINAAINAPIDYHAEPEDPRPEAGWTPHSEQIKAFAAAAKTAEAILIIGA
jgi:molybdopterin-containing oxidoreductase family iron-sulfur binding subunit